MSEKEHQLIIINRLRRKADVMRLDQKMTGSPRAHDTSEILTLLDLLENSINGGKSNGK